jgi:hypothetical protein
VVREVDRNVDKARLLLYIHVNQKLKHMTHKIFLCEERVPFLLEEMIHGKVKVIETDDHGMSKVEIIIDDSFDLLKFFHAGMLAGEKTSQPKPKMA